MDTVKSQKLSPANLCQARQQVYRGEALREAVEYDEILCSLAGTHGTRPIV